MVKTFGSPVAVAPDSSGSRQPATPPLTAENLAKAQAAETAAAAASTAAGVRASAVAAAEEQDEAGAGVGGGAGCRSPDTGMSRQPLAGLITPLEIKVSRLSAKLLVSQFEKGGNIGEVA